MTMPSMHQEKITAIFDQMASSYDEKWRELAPINDALHLLTRSVLAGLPEEANILCVGAGTGTEILALAGDRPGWRFTAVEPSTAMLNVFRQRAEERGIVSRCALHAGLLDSLPKGEPFHAATAFLVSQFILDRAARVQFFRGIADRLHPEGVLVSSDLAGNLETEEGRRLLEVWFRLMRGTAIAQDELEKMREAYTQDVAVRPAEEVRKIIEEGGFEKPAGFFQTGMIHGWCAKSFTQRR